MEGPRWWAGHHHVNPQLPDRTAKSAQPDVSGFYYAHIGCSSTTQAHRFDATTRDARTLRDRSLSWRLSTSSSLFIPPAIARRGEYLAGRWPGWSNGFGLPTMTLGRTRRSRSTP